MSCKCDFASVKTSTLLFHPDLMLSTTDLKLVLSILPCVLGILANLAEIQYVSI